MDWDLSNTHRPSDIGWDGDNEAGSFDSVSSLRITLPEGRVFEAGDDVREVIFSRDGDELDDLQVTFEEQTAEEAYERASQLVRDWGLDGENIDKWFAEARGKAGDEASEVDDSGAFATVFGPPGAGQLGPGGPEVTVEVRYSFDDDRPWVVAYDLGWP